MDIIFGIIIVLAISAVYLTSCRRHWIEVRSLEREISELLGKISKARGPEDPIFNGLFNRFMGVKYSCLSPGKMFWAIKDYSILLGDIKKIPVEVETILG